MSIFGQMNIWIAETKHRRMERRRKREADELVSDLESFLDEERNLRIVLV